MTSIFSSADRTTYLLKRAIKCVFLSAALAAAVSCAVLPESKPDTPLQMPSVSADVQEFSLTIAHLNDTHSHLEPTKVKVRVGDRNRTLVLGGFPRIATLADQLRRQGNLLFLHAGDAFQGTLYFTQFQGRADWEMLNLLRIDAMTLGNHEFDKGPALVGEMADNSRFPLVAANVDAGKEPTLEGKIRPYTVVDFGNQRIGIIGLAMADTAGISNPGERMLFGDPIAAAGRYVAILKEQGVNKIIVLSHNGYEHDLRLAASVSDIDIIVGGHSHTLLGGSDFTSHGLSPQGPYPTVVEAPDGKKVLIVSAWEWGKVLGVLDVTFNRQGAVTRYQGKPLLVEQTIAEDSAVKQKLEEYRMKVEALERQVVAEAVEDLPRYDSAGNPVLGWLVADSMLWKVRKIDPSVTVAVQNSGGVRADINCGRVSVGTVMTMLPFDNSLVVIDLRGSELISAIDESVDAYARGKIRGPAIVAGLRYGVDLGRQAGHRITFAKIHEPSVGWQPLDPARVYRVVTNSYLASGGDFSDTLKNAKGYRRDTSIGDADAFIEYASAIKRLKRLAEPMLELSLLTVPRMKYDTSIIGFPQAAMLRLSDSNNASMWQMP